MTRLSVNINKTATLRNSRGGNTPNVLKIAQDCEHFGAQGITIHPRPDERHIRYQDARDLKSIVSTELNIEGNPNPKFVELVMSIVPEQVTLVPDGPNALTSNSGWDTVTHLDFLKDVITEFKSAGIRTSIFTGTDKKIIEYAAKTGADRIELYTEPYAEKYAENRELAVKPFAEAAKVAHLHELGINAGHDLSLENLMYFNKNVPHLDEVSIGHALIADALYYGLHNTIQMYLRKLS